MLAVSDSLLTALWKQKGDREASRRDAAPGSCINVAISRQAGSGGSEIAQLVAQRLGWDLYDHKLLTRMEQESHLPQGVLERVDERHVSWLEAMAVSFGALKGSREGAYMPSLRAVLRELSKQGHCVIVGRGAAFYLPDRTTLCVRLVAPRPNRIARAQQLMELSAEEAGRWIDEKDRERRDFVRLEFGRVVEDSLAYDLVLNTGHLTLAQCADLIVEAARAREADLRA